MCKFELNKCLECQFTEYDGGEEFNDKGEVNIYMRCCYYPNCIEDENEEEKDEE